MRILKNATAFAWVMVLGMVYSCVNKNQDYPDEFADQLIPFHYDPLDVRTTLNCYDEEVEWTYDLNDPAGPYQWANICSEWNCDGEKQSPVNIEPNFSWFSPIRFYLKWDSSKVHIMNNGRVVQFNYDPGSHVAIRNSRYELQQLHFHIPSEHTLEGEYYPGEVHFVHQNPENGELAIIAVFLTFGEANAFFENFLPHFPAPGKQYIKDTTFSAKDLAPFTLNNFWRYQGSLTTPPCYEMVHWLVMQHPVTISPDQFLQMTKIFYKNFRPTVPLGNRRLLHQ